MVSLCSTEIASGTSSRPCSRFCAVTTISSMVVWASAGAEKGSSAVRQRASIASLPLRTGVVPVPR